MIPQNTDRTVATAKTQWRSRLTGFAMLLCFVAGLIARPLCLQAQEATMGPGVAMAMSAGHETAGRNCADPCCKHQPQPSRSPGESRDCVIHCDAVTRANLPEAVWPVTQVAHTPLALVPGVLLAAAAMESAHTSAPDPEALRRFAVPLRI